MLVSCVTTAGVFLFSHIIYCSVDRYECIDFNNYGDGPPSAWSKAQKSVAFVLCCVGCAVYALSKNMQP